MRRRRSRRLVSAVSLEEAKHLFSPHILVIFHACFLFFVKCDVKLCILFVKQAKQKKKKKLDRV